METQNLLTAGEAAVLPQGTPEDAPSETLTPVDVAAFFDALLNPPPPPPPPPPSAAPVEAVAPTPTIEPRAGDLFTNDFSTFHEVRDTRSLVASRDNLILHIPQGGDWKTALSQYVELNPSVVLWEANGIPTLVDPSAEA